jgi:hypothetical protein
MAAMIRMGSAASCTVARIVDLGTDRRYTVNDQVKIRETRAGTPLGTAGIVVGLHQGGAFIRYTEGHRQGSEELCWDDEIVVAPKAGSAVDL